MTPMIDRLSAPPARPLSGWRLLAVVLLVEIVVLSGALGAGLWYANRRASDVFENALRQFVFRNSEQAGFRAARLDLFRGQFAVDGIRVRSRNADAAVEIGADSVVVDLPLRDLFSGRAPVRSVWVRGPRLSVQGVGEAGGKFRFFWPGAVTVGEVRVTEGQATFSLAGRPLDLTNLEATVRGLGAETPAVPLTVEFSGRCAPAGAGSFSGSLTVQDPVAPLAMEGELKISDLSLAEVGAFFPDSDVRILDGRLNINSQWTAKNDWLTASHLVDIQGLKLDLKGDSVFGVSAKRLQSLLAIDRISFVVPMNGSLTDPHVGIASSIEQILLKVLEGKMEDRDDLERWARRGGNYLGAKVDRAIKDALNRRRSLR